MRTYAPVAKRIVSNYPLIVGEIGRNVLFIPIVNPQMVLWQEARRVRATNKIVPPTTIVGSTETIVLNFQIVNPQTVLWQKVHHVRATNKIVP